MIGVLLLAFGGPHSLDEISSFVKSMMSKRQPSPRALEIIKERYRQIGGHSPLPEITFQQAKLLEEKMNLKERKFRVYVGFRYSHPTIEETVKEMVKDKMGKVIVLSLSPYYSKVSTGAYIEEFQKTVKKLSATFEISIINDFGNHPLYLKVLANKIEGELKKLSQEERKNMYIIFTAHNIPRRLIEEGDPYLDQLKASINTLVRILGISNWGFAFQSRGLGGNEWLGPEVQEIVDELSEMKLKNILLVSLSFVADNLEILYDIDIVYKKYAEEKGLNFIRTSCLNTSPKFIEVLTTIIQEYLERNEKSCNSW